MTSPPHTPAAASDRFTRREDAGRDFPYYNGAPTAISTAQWLFVLAIVTGNRPRFGAHHRMTTHHNLPTKG